MPRPYVEETKPPHTLERIALFRAEFKALLNTHLTDGVCVDDLGEATESVLAEEW